MCGLACVVELRGGEPPRGALTKLGDLLGHRGPDDAGQFVSGNVGLTFRRLSIIDLSAGGHQPMLSGSGRYAIVFNGEIFNYLELRAELEAKGHVFHSASDTEVLLEAYVEWGEQCLERLNGMWAFIILDTVSGECFCSRDRFGIKPLYWLRTADRVILASEAQAVLRSGLCNAQVDRQTVAKYLFFGDMDHGVRTLHEGIEAVEPGTWLSIDREGHVRSGRYWTMPDDTDDSAPDLSGLYNVFHDSVRLRLRSDVPVGVFLSGGLDSTSILCSAEAELGANHALNAYAFMSPDYDESRYIGDTIKQTDATLVPLEVDNDRLWEQLVRMTRYQDGPVHTPSALIGFCLCELAAKRGTKVVLNGQGADETWAGYSVYFGAYWQALLTRARFRTLLAQLRRYGAQHQIDTTALVRQVIARFLRIQLNRAKPYRWAAGIRHRADWLRHPLYSRALGESLPRYRAYRRDHGLGEVLRQSVTVSALPLYLRVEDRNSMAHSIEARLPFLDHRLVTAIMRVTATRKLDGFWNKVLLREAMRGHIPESVRTRPDKMGFATPDAKWIRAWAPNIEEIFRSRSFSERGFFNLPNLLDALRDHVAGIRDRHEDIFRAVQVELCLRATEHAA